VGAIGGPDIDLKNSDPGPRVAFLPRGTLRAPATRLNPLSAIPRHRIFGIRALRQSGHAGRQPDSAGP
jgi:hypothetical protein